MLVLIGVFVTFTKQEGVIVSNEDHTTEMQLIDFGKLYEDTCKHISYNNICDLAVKFINARDFFRACVESGQNPISQDPIFFCRLLEHSAGAVETMFAYMLEMRREAKLHCAEKVDYSGNNLPFTYQLKTAEELKNDGIDPPAPPPVVASPNKKLN